MNIVLEEVSDLSQVTEMALALSHDDQAALLFRLEQNLASQQPDAELERAWSIEIKRRIREVESGEVELIDADVVMREVRERLAR